jgi:hypothetical protein
MRRLMDHRLLLEHQLELGPNRVVHGGGLVRELYMWERCIHCHNGTAGGWKLVQGLKVVLVEWLLTETCVTFNWPWFRPVGGSQ